MTMTIKTASDIEGMRVAGRLASEVLDLLTPLIKPGVPISGTRLSDWLHRKAHGDK